MNTIRPVLLTRLGLMGQSSSIQEPAALDDAAAWKAMAEAFLEKWPSRPDGSALKSTGVDLVIDGAMTLAGVIHGPIWSLSEADLMRAAQAWCQQQTGGGAWLVSAVAQRDGRHAVVAAMPAAPLWGVRDAFAARGLHLRRALPLWALQLADRETDSDARVMVALRSQAWPSPSTALSLCAHRHGGAWRSIELEPTAAAACEPHPESAPLETLPHICPKDSVLALDFHARPSARPTRAAQAILALLGIGFVASIAAAAVDGSAWTRAEQERAAAPLPQTASAPVATLPLSTEVLESLGAELAHPWLSALDRIAHTRPSDIHLQRVEPSVASTAVPLGLRLIVTGQATEPGAVLAWMRKLEAEPELASARLTGWQKEADGSAVAFQLEVRHAARP